LWSVAAVIIKERDLSKDVLKEETRLRKLLEISSGSGMQALNRKGNFIRPKSSQQGTPLHYYIYGGREPTQLGQDASLEGVKGIGDDAKFEYQQWAWINEWDNELKKAGFETLSTPPSDVPPIPEAKEPQSS
jgi:hypothetical protein